MNKNQILVGPIKTLDSYNRSNFTHLKEIDEISLQVNIQN